MFRRAVWNTAYFVLMTVIPGTIIALMIALGVSRLNGRFQAMVLALFFLPYILPVSVVYLIWDWTLNFQFGIAMRVLDWLGMRPRACLQIARVVPSGSRGGDNLVDGRLLYSPFPSRPARHTC